LKCNTVADPVIVESLYRASSASVQIDCAARHLHVRAGAGSSDNIRARCILRRYLDTAASTGSVTVTSAPKATRRADVPVGSADLMRNLDRRVGCWFDRYPSAVVARPGCWRSTADDIVRWELRPDDSWEWSTAPFEPDA
jgi:polyphosphate kinase